jgi:hypothetical protein
MLTQAATAYWVANCHQPHTQLHLKQQHSQLLLLLLLELPWQFKQLIFC